MGSIFNSMKYGLLLFFLLGTIRLFAQQILWEKKFGWTRDDEFNDGVQISENSAIAIGRSRKFGTVVGSTSKLGMIAVKINLSTGDTNWLKPLNQLCYEPKCVMGDNNLIYIVASESISPNRLLLSLLDTNGNLFYRTTLDSNGIAPSIEKIIRTTDGHFLIIGTRLGLNGSSNDMYAVKFDWLGNVIWNRRYNANPNSGGNHVEENPYNQYLLSGNAGSRIWRIKIDSAGNVLEDNFLYQTPSFVNFNEYASVKLHPNPDSSSVLSGMMSGSTSRFYLGRHLNVGNQKVFGGERPGGVGKPFINTDGNFWVAFGSPDSTNFKKLDQDSTVLANIPLRGRMNAFGAGITQLVYLPDESAIGLGGLFYMTSQATDFYFCRISNVGVPYDPSILVSNQEKIKGEVLCPFPNPTQSSLVFKGLKEDGVLYLYDLRGQVVKQLDIKPYQRIYLQDLPKGLYPYRVQTKKGFYVGKVVRE
jgi:hypothetical protein